MTPYTIICFDIGRSRCRRRVYVTAADGRAAQTSDGTVVTDSGSTLSDLDGAERVAGLVGESLAQLELLPDRATLVVATAGAVEHGAAARELAERLSGTHRGPVVVTGDVVAAHAGCVDGRGVVLVAGSGAVALGVDATGRATKVDGAGHLLGDAGGGFWVGRAGLDAALRHHDGRPGGSAPLAAAAADAFGELSALPAVLHARADAARTVASFAPHVATTARGGDAVSRGIWQRAVEHLAETVDAAAGAVAADREGAEVPVATVGGLLACADLLANPLTDRLARRWPRVADAEGDPLLGAARLGSGAPGPYERLLVRTADDSCTNRETEEARR